MSKYNKRLRIRPVINSLVAEPRYYYECKDWYGGVGTGLTIPQAVEDYLKETKTFKGMTEIITAKPRVK